MNDFHRRKVDLQALVTDIVLSRWTTLGTRTVVEALVRDIGDSIPTRESVLARHATMLPTGDELRRFS